MKPFARHLRSPLVWGLVACAAFPLGSPCVHAQQPDLVNNVRTGATFLGTYDQWATTADDSAHATQHAPRLKLLGTPSGASNSVMNRELETDPALDIASPTASNDGLSDIRIEAGAGSDNPLFDLRPPGSPGGFGFDHYYATLFLVDTSTTDIALTCHAVTPAGQEFSGVSEGPTVITPSITWFQELGGGTAIQGFIGKNVRANTRNLDSFQDNLHYGFALQQPIPGIEELFESQMFLFVAALGSSHLDQVPGVNVSPNRWDIVPGIHWRAGDNWWLSGGVLLPVGRTDSGLWKVTCSWLF